MEGVGSSNFIRKKIGDVRMLKLGGDNQRILIFLTTLPHPGSRGSLKGRSFLNQLPLRGAWQSKFPFVLWASGHLTARTDTLFTSAPLSRDRSFYLSAWQSFHMWFSTGGCCGIS